MCEKGAKMILIIDPGHRNNTNDFGATGNGLKESAIALFIAKKIKAEFENKGHKVYLTRESESQTISIDARWKKAKELKGDYLISIHINASTGTTATGVEVLYKTEKTMAENISKEMAIATGLRDRGAKQRADLGVLNGFEKSVLVECGFINNPQEAKIMNTEDFQNKLSQAVVKEFLKTLGIKDKENYIVEKTSIKLCGKDKVVEVIKYNDQNYIKLRDLENEKIIIGYDAIKKQPTVEVK